MLKEQDLKDVRNEGEERLLMVSRAGNYEGFSTEDMSCRSSASAQQSRDMYHMRTLQTRSRVTARVSFEQCITSRHIAGIKAASGRQSQVDNGIAQFLTLFLRSRGGLAIEVRSESSKLWHSSGNQTSPQMLRVSKL